MDNGNAKKILVVEDEPDLREFYSKLLTTAGFSVNTADNGESAYQQVKTNLFDLVLLDMVLPGMSGLDVLQKMQTEGSSTSPSDTIILTNIDDPKTVADAMAYGVIGYIVKSDTTPDKVLDIVKKNLG